MNGTAAADRVKNGARDIVLAGNLAFASAMAVQEASFHGSPAVYAANRLQSSAGNIAA
ncbi:hypothetical protein [Bradyrhizobium elkanii]|uniref:hypothetical protein n=1 Tax=Bradyrhizobium elkanii TaxID=29448 RepID=UPI0035150FA4